MTSTEEPKVAVVATQTKIETITIAKWLKDIKSLLEKFEWDGGIYNISMILPEFLWLGDEDDAGDIQKLNKLGINFVINCAGTDIENIEYPDDFQVLNIDAEDDEEFDLRVHFEKCIKFINKCKEENGKILIHCVAGMNRSPTVIVAYLIHSCDMHLLQAIKHTVCKRGWILTNDAFKRQLIAYAGTIQKLCEYDWNKTTVEVKNTSENNENSNENKNNTNEN